MPSVAPVNESYSAFRERFDGAVITTYVFSMLFVPLKIWCRQRSGGWSNMGFDEVFTVLGAALVTCVFGVIVGGVQPLLGKRIVDVSQSPSDMAKLPAFTFYLWLGNLFYVLAVMFIKLSIVSLYWRLFGLTKQARIPLISLAAIIVAWGISIGAMVIFNCDPIAGSWDLNLAATAKCVDKKSFYVGGSVPNVITDIFLVVTPLPYVWKLHASLTQRIVLAGIFALGTFVAVVSIIRLSVLLDTASGPFDVTYTFKDVYLWSLVEINVGLTCACLPSLRPIARLCGLGRLFSSGRSGASDRVTPDSSKVLSGKSGGYVSSRGSRKKPNLFSIGDTHMDNDDEFEMISESKPKMGTSMGDSASRISSDTVNTTGGSANSQKQDAIPAIVVQRDWHVTSTPIH